jgi:hypothetical protein
MVSTTTRLRMTVYSRASRVALVSAALLAAETSSATAVSTPRSRSILAEERRNHPWGSSSTLLPGFALRRALRRKLRSSLVWSASGLAWMASSRELCSPLEVVLNWDRQVSWAPRLVANRWSWPGANRPAEAAA